MEGSLFGRLCENGNVAQVQEYIAQNSTTITNSDWREAIRNAYQRNNEQLIELLHKYVELSRVFESVMEGACFGGHVHLMQRLLSFAQVDYDTYYGLYEDMSWWVGESGSKDAAHFMVENKIVHWNQLFVGACSAGHVPIVSLAIENGANAWGDALLHACWENHFDVVNLLLSKDAKHVDRGLHGACYGGCLPMVQFMISKGAKDINEGLFCALSGPHYRVAAELVKRGAVFNFNEHCNRENILGLFEFGITAAELSTISQPLPCRILAFEIGSQISKYRTSIQSVLFTIETFTIKTLHVLISEYLLIVSQ